MVLVVITLFLLLVYALLMAYYYYHWVRLPHFKSNEIFSKTFVSVVVAARNEEAALPNLLAALALQTYPKELFEVIIVDDFSTDKTATVALTQTNGFVKVIQPSVPADQSSKKKAIEAGVLEAKGGLIVITDADCTPPPQWLQTMTAMHRQNGAAFIAAPVQFTHNQSLLHIFQAVDFITLQGITAASVAANFHSMCNGANLAYTKGAFVAVKGFEGIDQVASGDDMLLMYKIWKQQPHAVQYLKSKEAIVTTAPMNSWKDFIDQRRRWASKTAYYDDYRVMAVLLFIYFFNCWFIVLVIATFLKPFYGWWLLAYLVAKIGIEWPFVQSVAQFYNERRLMRYFPLLQPLHIVYTISIGLLSQLGKYHWKGRRTK